MNEVMKNQKAYMNGPKITEEYYNGLVNDEAVVIKADMIGGGGTFLSYTNKNILGVFVNGILYRLVDLEPEWYLMSITVPATVSDDDFEAYVVEKIKAYLSLDDEENLMEYYYGNYGVSISKGITVDEEGYDTLAEIPNIYTVAIDGEYSDEDIYDVIIINREVAVENTDEDTNIILETSSTVVPENTVLVVEEIKTGATYELAEKTIADDVEKFVVYEITLQSEGVAIQPNGKVKIMIPIPEGFNKENLVVYRISENGEKTKYEVKVETVEGKFYAVFETDHFSVYTLAEEKIETTVNNDTTPETTETPTLDNTPKTGNNEYAYIVFLVAIITACGIVALKK